MVVLEVLRLALLLAMDVIVMFLDIMDKNVNTGIVMEFQT
jgi:hypothetical protein